MTGGAEPQAQHVDVAICGAGVAGLSAAILLRRRHPDLTLAIFETRTEETLREDFKVGESLTEYSTLFFQRDLGLAEVLERQIRKMGLRFVLPGVERLAHRFEIGPDDFEPVPSYQINRRRFDGDLREILRSTYDQPLSLGEQVMLKARGSGDGPHVLRVMNREGISRTVTARWLIDATGRSRLALRSAGQAPSPTGGGSVWFRVDGRISLDEMGSREDSEWRRRVAWPAGASTTHLMGPGRWVWIIPLAGDVTSLGIVGSHAALPFRDLVTLDGALAWLAENEPELSARLAGATILDFRRILHYSQHPDRVFHDDRVVLIGDSGPFPDPMFSPGIDLIGQSCLMLSVLLDLDRRGTLDEAALERCNMLLLSQNMAATVLPPPMSSPQARGRKLAMRLIWETVGSWALSAPQRFFPGYYEQVCRHGLSRAAQSASALLQRGRHWIETHVPDDVPLPAGSRLVLHDIPGVGDLYVDSLRPYGSLEEMEAQIRANATFLEKLLQAFATLQAGEATECAVASYLSYRF